MLTAKELLCLWRLITSYQHEKGETFEKVALDLVVEEVTEGDWRRKRAEIKKWCSQKDNESDKRNTMRTGEFDKT